MVRRSRGQPPHRRRLLAAGIGGTLCRLALLLLLLLLAVGSVQAVRRLPGTEAGRRRLQPAEESAMEQAFETLGRRGLAADATYVIRESNAVCVCLDRPSHPPPSTFHYPDKPKQTTGRRTSTW